MNKKAIIFDLDGTLVNTLDDIADSVNDSLAHYGYPTHATDEIRRMIGKGAKNLITRALPSENRDDKTVTEVLEYYRKRYSDNIVVKTHAYDGICGVLEELHSKGVRMAVLSNKDDGQVKEIAGKLLPDVFEIVNGFSPEFPHKPAPDSVLDIMSKMAISADETALVGDSVVDVLTARNANIMSVGVIWGFGGEEEFDDTNPDLTVKSASELLKL